MPRERNALEGALIVTKPCDFYTGSPVEIVSHFSAIFAGSVLPFKTLMHRRPTIMNDGGGVPTVRFNCLIPRSVPFPARAFRVRGASLK